MGQKLGPCTEQACREPCQQPPPNPATDTVQVDMTSILTRATQPPSCPKDVECCAGLYCSKTSRKVEDVDLGLQFDDTSAGAREPAKGHQREIAEDAAESVWLAREQERKDAVASFLKIHGFSDLRSAAEAIAEASELEEEALRSYGEPQEMRRAAKVSEEEHNQALKWMGELKSEHGRCSEWSASDMTSVTTVPLTTTTARTIDEVDEGTSRGSSCSPGSSGASRAAQSQQGIPVSVGKNCHDNSTEAYRKHDEPTALAGLNETAYLMMVEAELDAEEAEAELKKLASEDEKRRTADREAVAAFLSANGFSSAVAGRRRMMKTSYPLHVAAEKGDARMVELLLLEGADPELKDSSGRLPAEIARKRGHNCLNALGVLEQKKEAAEQPQRTTAKLPAVAG